MQKQIRPDDTVFCDCPFYYLAKEKARKVFVGRYSRVMTPEEFDSLDLVLLSKTFCDWSYPETLRARAAVRADWDPSRAGLLGTDWRYPLRPQLRLPRPPPRASVRLLMALRSSYQASSVAETLITLTRLS